MNILVTGGLGLIGHNVVKRLQDQGHLVSIMDTKTTYGIIPHAEIDYLMTERRKKIDADSYIYDRDICDIDDVDYVFNIEQPEIVIHMASFPRQKVVNANPSKGSRVMSEGLLNLLEASTKYKVRKFIYISSSMVYGDFKDDVTEDAVCNGASETLDFTYVDDAADGIVAASLSDNTENKTYNITKSHSYSLLDAANLAVNIAGSGTVNVRDKDPDFPTRGALNINAARKDFGFDPKVDVEEGFRNYYEWLSNSTYFTK